MTEPHREDQEPTSYGLQPPVPPQRSEGYQPTVAASPAPSDENRVIGGRYRLLSRLGHGGMGTVWRAEDQVIGRWVAVKEPRPPEYLDEASRGTLHERMRREARAAAMIDHPSVVTVHDVVVEGGQPWIVMELVNGRSLAAQLEDGTLSAAEAARVGLAVAGALSEAHERGVQHRDVKPENVLLGRHDRVVLTDFGIAQVEGESRLTESGAFVGSPEYVAPERVLGRAPGSSSDLWSLGALLYTAVQGVSPFRRSNAQATFQAVLSHEPSPPDSGSTVLDQLIVRLMHKEPHRRPDARETARVLSQVAAPPPPRAGAGWSPRSLWARTPGWLRTHRKAQLGLGGGVLAVVVALLLVWNLTGDDLPDGYQRYDETKRVRASLAVPEKLQRSVEKGAVEFATADDSIRLRLTRPTGLKGSVVDEANKRKDFYKEGAFDNGYEMSDAVVRVNESTFHDADAARIDTTYKPYGEREGILRCLRKELFVNGGEGVEWQLYVDMPTDKERRAEGERIFDNAVRSLELKGL
ncbi:serine/threonine-protein kinase [Streptomyces sp. NPDC005438]|uniref:serine/threonine-protein kinase n=1 Tax=Streptomyces sp. NPDC005438 TaxID=3156880 RepID=UPI0033B5E531